MKQPVFTQEEATLSAELQDFLKEMFPKEAKRKVFTPDMGIFQTFGLDDDEIRVFFSLFVARFNIKIGNNFRLEDRFDFDEEGGTLWDLIHSLLFGIPMILITLLFFREKLEDPKDMTFYELDKAIKTGVLE